MKGESRKTIWWLLVVALALSLIAAACGGAAPSAPAPTQAPAVPAAAPTQAPAAAAAAPAPAKPKYPKMKLRAANFLETGGGITEELLYKVTDLVLQKKGIRGLFINVYGGINPIHEGAKGVVRYLDEHKIKIPVVARALGNHQEETWQIFREHGVHVVASASTEQAIDELSRLLKGAN